MFEADVKDKIKEKIQYDISLLKEYLLIYLQLYWLFPDNLELRDKFTSFLKGYYVYSWLEYKLLIKIKNTKYNPDLEELCLNIFADLDNIFFKQFYYNEYVLNGYEEAISLKDVYKASVPTLVFETLNEEKYKELVKKLI